mgnify:CR=1 FL=1
MDASPPCTRLPALAAPPRALTPDEEREFAFFGCVLLEVIRNGLVLATSVALPSVQVDMDGNVSLRG